MSFHVVRSGETAGTIASKHGVTVSQLKSWNNLNKKAMVRAGQKLKLYSNIRTASSESPASSSPRQSGNASAGGHLNPHGKQHGMENPQGSHLGDLPNLSIGADGKGSFSVPLNGSPAEIEALLFDADGTALVVHAKPDDYRTDPSGNSGPRIACGVLTRP